MTNSVNSNGLPAFSRYPVFRFNDQPSSFALMPRMKVWENAAFGLDVSGYALKERKNMAMAALEQVGLRSNATSYERAAEEYIKAHPKRVNCWVAGKLD
jgi:ABC-type Fe3+/spermidine/putrescine transport system ATPase subunit